MHSWQVFQLGNHHCKFHNFYLAYTPICATSLLIFIFFSATTQGSSSSTVFATCKNNQKPCSLIKNNKQTIQLKLLLACLKISLKMFTFDINEVSRYCDFLIIVKRRWWKCFLYVNFLCKKRHLTSNIRTMVRVKTKKKKALKINKDFSYSKYAINKINNYVN